MNSEIASLIQPFGGVLKELQKVPMKCFIDRAFSLYSTSTGNLSALFDNAITWNCTSLWGQPLGGAGGDLVEDLARLKAVCEAAERYSASVLVDGEFTIGSYSDVKNPIDYRRWARFSDVELAYPGQMFSNYDPEKSIRWINAWNMTNQCVVSVPSVMTHLYPRSWSSERFWNPISTGLAVHTDPILAIVSGACEVIERDAIALNWLLMKPLPRINFSDADMLKFPPAFRQFLSEDSGFIFYDATTDIGLPTVYVRRFRPNDPKAMNLVGCSSDFCVKTACIKALRETLSISAMFTNTTTLAPENPYDCIAIEDGAKYMAHPDRSRAFDFLDEQGSHRAFAELVKGEPLAHVTSTPADMLRWLVDRLKLHGKDLIVADLTCDELRSVGLNCFRALVPDLMPMSTIMKSRYLASSRLTNALGEAELGESQNFAFNPNPQPFA